MNRSNLPKSCHKSDLRNQETLVCQCGRRLPPRWTATPSLAAELDPDGTLHWACPDELCHGPFED